MQRYFASFLKEDNVFLILGEDYHHLVRVMRMKTGDSVICVNDEGEAALCQVIALSADKVVAEVVHWLDDSVELPVNVTIASGLPKGDKLDWIIQKGTELGAYTFIPFYAARSIAKWDEKKAAKKTERLQKIAKEAAEQAHRSFVPNVKQPISVKELVDLSDHYDFRAVASEEAAKDGETAYFARVLHELTEGHSLLLVFGPEGGLSEKEVDQLKEAGFVACGLGPRILRTETAPLYALSAISYHFELAKLS
ncbi:16S rRNA (uracil(1498)-N(3))-methyltransferase [Bacillaceae bacterium Marseille-Q3522]|nr:16S rRNA (uracil(1498)-N(3))-methyltransferase [Bacillaceae bacterium Marseille-Q3522]